MKATVPVDWVVPADDRDVVGPARTVARWAEHDPRVDKNVNSPRILDELAGNGWDRLPTPTKRAVGESPDRHRECQLRPWGPYDAPGATAATERAAMMDAGAL